jgi:hypothetical protein
MNTQLHFYYKRFVVIFLLLGFVLFLSAWYENKIKDQRIFFVDNFNFTRFQHLSIMDFDGNHPQHLTLIKYTIAINRDKNLLAAGCYDSASICLYNIDNFPDWSIYPPKAPVLSPYVGKFPIPEICSNTQADQISSLSWSRDAKRLLVICKNSDKSNACIGDLEGGYHCWEETTGEDIYSRADWSPKEDLIIIDTGKQYELMPAENDGFFIKRTGRRLRIVTPEGTTEKTLVDGWSPVWSPDGKEIAFFRADDERRNPGIAIIKPDGTDFHWVYRSPAEDMNKLEYIYRPIILDSFDEGGSSKISWSQDKKYLIFDSGKDDYSGYYVFKLEISTGKIEKLTTNITGGFHETTIY